MNAKKRLFRRIFPPFMALILISIGAMTWYASHFFKIFYLNRAASEIETRIRILKLTILPLLDPLSSEEVDRFCKTVGAGADTRVTVILPNGRVVGDSSEAPDRMDNHLDRPEIRAAIREKRGSAIRHSRTLDRRMMYVAVTFEKDNAPVGILRAAVPLTAMDEALKSIRLGMVGAGVLVGLLASMICLLVAKRVADPIETLRSGAERLAGGRLDYRFAPQDIWELDRLVESMNQMASELQKKMEIVRSQRNEYQAVLSSMVEGVIGLDNQERIISVNHAAMAILGKPEDQLKDRGIHEVIRNRELQAFIEKAMNVESMIHDDIRLLHDGERILSVVASPLQDIRGDRIGILLVMQDATQIRRLEMMRRDFVANVSHEIKTPLTAIKGFVETLRSGAMRNEEEAGRFLEIIDRHVNRLTDIVEDLLQLSRIEQEDEIRRLRFEDCRALELIQSAIWMCQSKAGGKKIAIERQCEESLMIQADPRLMEQALTNLLDNAIKYSPENGMVRITASKEGVDVAFRVTDQGAGIARKHLPRLFERFYRVDRARSRTLGGTGLGLAIVKHIAQAHGGSVAVESTPGEGSTFFIRVPGKHITPLEKESV